MPRDANGNMTLPAGNPVVTDTLITSVWANTTMGDLRNEMTDSLSRSGKGNMLASLSIIDGTKTTPGVNGASEPTSGLYRAGNGDWRFSVLDQDIWSTTTSGFSVTGDTTVSGKFIGDASDANVTATNGIARTLKNRFLEGNRTVNVPGDHATIQDAFNAETHWAIAKANTRIDINIQAGHQPTAGLSVFYGDYGHIRIVSEDAEVTLAASFPAGTDFLAGQYSVMPQLHCLINASGRCRHGVFCADNSSVVIISGAGVKNAGERGLYLNSCSSATAQGSIFSGAGQTDSSLGRGLWVTRTSQVNGESADFSGCLADVAAYFSRNSKGHLVSANFSNCAQNAMFVHRSSKVNAHSANFDGCAGAAGGGAIITVDKTSELSMNNSTMLLVGTGGYTGDALLAFNGSTVHARETTITAGAGNNGNGVHSTTSSKVVFTLSTVSGFGNRNVFLEIDGAISGDGIQILNGGQHNVFAAKGGKFYCQSCTITGAPAGKDIEVQNASEVNAIFCTTSSSTGGSPNIADVTGVPSFNTITNRNGIVWA